MDDHAPLGELVAFRCEPNDLLNSALYLWGESMRADADEERVEKLCNTAMWYEAMARTANEIRSLPEPSPELLERIRRYC